MTDYSKTLIRCHALGQIMGSPDGKTPLDQYNDVAAKIQEEQAKYDAMPKKDGKMATNKLAKIEKLKEELEELYKVKDEIPLSKTCKSYLQKTYVLSKYGRVNEVKTKQMTKGVLVEDDSIELFSIFDGNIYQKNEERIKNEFISGTPDLYDGEDILNCNEIIDIKSSWDIFTFISNIEEPVPINYWWQLQGYMALTGAKIGTIAYCLVNTPDYIVEEEKYYLLKKLNVISEEDPAYKKEVVKLIQNRYFDDIPLSEKVLTVSIERDDDAIEKIYAKVKRCREYMAEFEEKHLHFSKKYRKTVGNVPLT